jgi:hypothetical protein
MRLVVIFACCPSAAQNNSPFSISGSIGIYADFYNFSSNDSTLRPRRPSRLIRIVGTPTLSFGKYFSLPLNLMTSFDQTNVTTPYVPNQNFGQFVKNPLQNFGIAPKYKWAQVFIGSHLPEYSELTVGVVQVFGAGIEVKPGRWLASINYGTTQRGIETDVTNNIPGIYERKMLAARIGFGSDTGTMMTLNFAQFKDDTSSITSRPSGIQPQQGIVIGPKIQVKLGQKFIWKAEAAFSQLQPNSIVSATKFLSDTARIKDYAATSSIGYNEKNYGATFNIKYIGAGFVPAGFPFFQPDRVEYTIAPRFNLFKNKLMVNGSIGQRINNISNTSLQKNKQLIGNANIFWQASERFSLNATYTNFGFRSNLTNGGLIYQLIGNSINISPTYNRMSTAAMHTITGNIGYDVTDDYNVATSTRFTNTTYNAMATYVYSSMQSPLSVTATISYFDTRFSGNKVKVMNEEITAGYRFFKKKLRSSLTLGMQQTSFNSFSNDNSITGRLKLEYTTKRRFAFGLTAGNNYYQYGSFKPGKHFNEFLVQTSIVKTF